MCSEIVSDGRLDRSSLTLAERTGSVEQTTGFEISEISESSSEITIISGSEEEQGSVLTKVLTEDRKIQVQCFHTSWNIFQVD